MAATEWRVVWNVQPVNGQAQNLVYLAGSEAFATAVAAMQPSDVDARFSPFSSAVINSVSVQSRTISDWA